MPPPQLQHAVAQLDLALALPPALPLPFTLAPPPPLALPPPPPPPLDSKMGWIAELWLKTNILNSQSFEISYTFRDNK